jgi:hypothetical protein
MKPDDIARLEIGIVRLLDDGKRAAAHHVAELHRRHVLLHVAHPDAVGGIEREIERAGEEFARSRRGQGRLRRIRDRRPDVAHGTFLKDPLSIDFGHDVSPG